MYKDYWMQETIYFQSRIDFLIDKIMSEGTFSHVVAHIWVNEFNFFVIFFSRFPQ